MPAGLLGRGRVLEVVGLGHSGLVASLLGQSVFQSVRVQRVRLLVVLSGDRLGSRRGRLHLVGLHGSRLDGVGVRSRHDASMGIVLVVTDDSSGLLGRGLDWRLFLNWLVLVEGLDWSDGSCRRDRLLRGRVVGFGNHVRRERLVLVVRNDVLDVVSRSRNPILLLCLSWRLHLGVIRDSDRIRPLVQVPARCSISVQIRLESLGARGPHGGLVDQFGLGPHLVHLAGLRPRDRLRLNEFLCVLVGGLPVQRDLRNRLVRVASRKRRVAQGIDCMVCLERQKVLF